jgi:hypothetical protein
MSIVVLKRNSRRFQAPISGRGHDGFSLVGGYRNVGAVGQTNLAKSVTRTRFRGNAPMGHGGCCGTYKISVCNSGSCCTNDPSIIKSTVKNTKGAILKQYKWIHSAYPRYWVKPDDSMPENYSQGIYVKKLTAQYSNCVVNKVDAGINEYCYSKIIETNQFYPPIAFSNNNDKIVSGNSYGNGKYVASASGSAGITYRAYNLFDFGSTIAKSNNRYDGSGAYTSTYSTSTTQNNIPIKGDYWSIELPTPIILYKFKLIGPTAGDGLPKGIVIVGNNSAFDPVSSNNFGNRVGPWDVLFETDDLSIVDKDWGYNKTIFINLNVGLFSKSYSVFRIIVKTTNGFSSAALEEWTLYEGQIVPDYDNKCKSASYHIGGKKYYRSFYSKDLNSRPTSCSQYVTAGLYKKNNLPTPPCLQSFPMNLSHNGCDVNYLTPQEAIAAGALPSDWMNCNNETNPNCVPNSGI